MPSPAGTWRTWLLPTAVALAVRVAWIRPERLVFDGHERGYVAAFHGHPPDPSTAAWPAAIALYQVLGQATSHPHAPVGLAVVAGGLTAGLVALACRRFGAGAALWAGLFVALLPEHAAWSTSVYPVVLPLALFVGSWLVPWVPATALVVAACSLRPDLAVLAPLRGWPGLGGLAGLAWMVTVPGASPSSPGVALAMNLPLVGFLGPPALLLATAGLRRDTWPLALAAAWAHLSGSAFDDYGPRHALLGGLALCGLAGVAAQRRPWLGGLVLAGLAWSSVTTARAWNRPFLAPDPTLPVVVDVPEGCIEVTEEPPLRGQPLLSHHLFWTGAITAPCVVWGEEGWHRAWTSRGLQDRARRLRWWYRPEPIAEARLPQGVRRYHRLTRPWWAW